MNSLFSRSRGQILSCGLLAFAAAAVFAPASAEARHRYRNEPPAAAGRNLDPEYGPFRRSMTPPADAMRSGRMTPIDEKLDPTHGPFRRS
jgi:hypothetical protein